MSKSWNLLPLLLLIVPLSAEAQSGSFTAVTYNVAGLPQALACCDPNASIPIIASNVFAEPWEIVVFQEAFVHGATGGIFQAVGSLYYTTLMSQASPMRFEFPPLDVPSGGSNSVASGLGRLSEFAISQDAPLLSCENASNDETKFCRQRFTDLINNDALSDKGYSFARHTIAPNTFLDVYNWHAQAGTATGGEFGARAANTRQLIAEINRRSTGNAVIVLGDTNSTYERLFDAIREMLTDTTGPTGTEDAPLKDVWVERERAGVPPAQAGPAFFPCDEAGAASMPRSEWGGPNCEWRDKIFYRSSSALTLAATDYFVITNYTNPSGGADLSDHYPTGATFNYTVVPEPSLALLSTTAISVLTVLRRRRLARSRG